jgi:hypothetical protein
MFAMTTFLPKTTRLAFTAAALVVTALVGIPDRASAAKAQPSPFAGCYLDYVAPDGVQHWYVITIDDSERISATIPLVGEMSGSISASGSMRVTVVERISSLDGGGRLVRRIKYSGHGALDEFSNLYGELKDQYGGVWQFYWWRCGPGVPGVP